MISAYAPDKGTIRIAQKPVGELSVPQIELLLESILKTYERLKELGFTYYNGKIVVPDVEEVPHE